MGRQGFWRIPPTSDRQGQPMPILLPSGPPSSGVSARWSPGCPGREEGLCAFSYFEGPNPASSEGTLSPATEKHSTLKNALLANFVSNQVIRNGAKTYDASPSMNFQSQDCAYQTGSPPAPCTHSWYLCASPPPICNYIGLQGLVLLISAC